MRCFTLLHVPLHVDLAAWSRIESVLDTFEGQQIANVRTTTLYERTRKITESLLREDNGSLKSTHLASLFSEKASAERGLPELVYRTRYSPLLDYLNEDHRLKFLRLADLGALLWKGDRVPEMADPCPPPSC